MRPIGYIWKRVSSIPIPIHQQNLTATNLCSVQPKPHRPSSRASEEPSLSRVGNFQLHKFIAIQLFYILFCSAACSSRRPRLMSPAVHPLPIFLSRRGRQQDLRGVSELEQVVIPSLRNDLPLILCVFRLLYLSQATHQGKPRS